MSNTEHTGGVKTIEDLLEEYANAKQGYDASDGKPIFTQRMSEAKAQLEALMQDYAIEARLEEKDFFMKYIDVGYTECHGLKCRLLWCGSCCGEDEAEEESAKAQKAINEHIAKLKQLRTTNQTLKGGDDE